MGLTWCTQAGQVLTGWAVHEQTTQPPLTLHHRKPSTRFSSENTVYAESQPRQRDKTASSRWSPRDSEVT